MIETLLILGVTSIFDPDDEPADFPILTAYNTYVMKWKQWRLLLFLFTLAKRISQSTACNIDRA